MDLPVPIPSVATLRLLWLVHLSKGTFSLEWPARLARDQHVKLVLHIGSRLMVLPARVGSCVPSRARFVVNLTLDPLTDMARHEIESALAMEVPVRC